MSTAAILKMIASAGNTLAHPFGHVADSEPALSWRCFDVTYSLRDKSMLFVLWLPQKPEEEKR